MFFVESHDNDSHKIRKLFRKHGFSASVASPQQTDKGGTHGGEIVAFRSYIHSTPILHNLLYSIQQEFQSPLRFAARTLRLKHVTVIMCTVYLWSTEGLSDRNVTILMQLNLLQKALSLPLFCIGDFNMLSTELVSSGWAETLKVNVKCPSYGNTSINSAADRMIDYILISKSIDHIFESAFLDYNVPWSPHFGLEVTFRAQPRDITGYVLCVPRALPLTTFHAYWKEYSESQRALAWEAAQYRAGCKLAAHKSKTGIAILGSPTNRLEYDEKFQGELKEQQLINGERLALASLSTEMLILDVAKVPIKEQYSYYGRSQYPKFKNKPLSKSSKPDQYQCEHLMYWISVRGCFVELRCIYICQALRNTSTVAGSTALVHAELQEPLRSLKQLLEESEFHFEHLDDSACAEVKAIMSSLSVTYLNLDIIKEFLQKLDGIITVHTNHICNEASKQFRSYVRSELSKGGGSLFKYISSEDKAFLNVQWDTQGGVDLTPKLFLDKQLDKWSSLWAPSDQPGLHVEVACHLRAMRQHALRNPTDHTFNAESLEKALKNYRKDTLGSDSWGSKELKQIPGCAKDAVATAIDNSLKTLAWPHQQLLSLNACLGKISGDCRTISKTPMIYRMALRADSTVRKWELDNMASFDSALPGASALSAALRRNLKAEVAYWLGALIATVLNDYEKFFDTLNIVELIRESYVNEFPAQQLVLALQQHLAPRVIQVNGFSSLPVSVFNSILAGCKHSVAFTRSFVKRKMHKVCDLYPHTDSRIFVDDTSMQTTASTIPEVLDQIVPTVSTWAQGALEQKLRLSNKGCIVTSNPKLSKLLQKELLSYGLTYRIEPHARDLGVTHAAGVRKPSQLLARRFKNVRNRILKIKQLSKIDRRARNLYAGSAFSASTWGHQASGFTEDQVVKLERQALACSGIRPEGRCRMAALLVTYGLNGAPHARIIRETCRSWIEALRNLPEREVADLRVAWSKAASKLTGLFRLGSASASKAVRGLMSNLIVLLLSAGWKPRAYNVWDDHLGNTWAIVDRHTSADAVALALINAFFAINCRRAASHYEGKGMEGGVNVEATLAVLRSLKDSRHYKFKCAIESIVAASCWPCARIHDIHPEVDPICQRCGQEPETSLHCYWTCPANCSIDDEAVVKTQALIPAAVSQSQDTPCLWLRGILPQHLVEIDPEWHPTSELHAVYVNPANVPNTDKWGTGVYYGDASGGDYSAYTALRRVGCAVARVSRATQNLEYGAKFNLPGSVQSVGRGEAYALLFLIEHAKALSDIEYVTDNEVVYNTFCAGPVGCARSLNSDLYRQIFNATVEKAIRLQVRWMPSHLDGEGNKTKRKRNREGQFVVTMTNLSHRASPFDIAANKIADTLAGEAAKRCNLPMHITSAYLYHYRLTKRIQYRLATILVQLPHRTKAAVEPAHPVNIPPLDDILAETRHVLYRRADKICCAGCSNQFSAKDPNLRAWLATYCSSAGSDRDRPIPLPFEEVHIGNRFTHISHRLNRYRGLVYCRKCGCRAGKSRLGKLCEPCLPPTEYGQASILALLQGKLPPGLDKWPDCDGPT